MSKGTFYRCNYTAEFPLDEYDRPGGFYSLADLPIVKYDKLTRRGVVEAKDEQDAGLKYKVRDIENNWVLWIPEEDVTIGEIHNGDPWSDWRNRKTKYE